MATPTPLLTLFENAQARWERYGGTAATATGSREPVAVAAAFDYVDIEYAALRKASALLDQPHRGVVEFTGSDRLPFLNRMVTQELKDAKPFECRRAFWLNRKGRIDADLRLIVLPDRVLADVEVFSAQRVIQTLEPFIIADDVTLTDRSQTLHRMALHGPGAAAVLDGYSRPLAGQPVAQITPGQVSVVSIAGHEVIVDRWDSAGEIGLELTMPSDAAVEVFQTLLQAAHQSRPGHDGPNHHARLKPIGWHAFNVARIEAGTPLYMIDFAGDALPAESGKETLHDRVSFKKGCYLGQEIVARMNALGHPKQTLTGLRVEGDAPALPMGGSPVFLDPFNVGAEPIGTVASATSSPMLGGTTVAFAMLKHKHAAEGTRVVVPCMEHPDAQPVLRTAVVQTSLRFWQRS